MQQRVLGGALVVVVLVGGGIVWRSMRTAATPPARATANRSPDSPEVVGNHGDTPSPSAGAEVPTPHAASGGAGARQQPEGRRRALDRVRADGVRQRAAGRTASQAKSAGAGALAAHGTPVPTPPAPKTPEEEERRRVYIRDAVREQYFPIARSCYSELLERLPTASGKVVLSFAIVGDGEDGVVDRVEFNDDTTLVDPEFALCLRESMYSTVFEPPPPGTEETTVAYPIVFAPGDPEDGDPAQNPGKVRQTSR
jgi:hypothetical protein